MQPGSAQLLPSCVPDSRRGKRHLHLRRAIGFAAINLVAAAILTTTAFAQSGSSAQSTSSVGQGQSTASAIPAPTEAPPEYRVGAGDVLGITVYNMTELNRTAVVGSDGALFLSYFSHPVKVNGQTAQEIGQDIAARLKTLQIVLYPQVSVAVIRVESKPVVVGGDVGTPQVLQEIRPFTLQEALMLAGGPRSNAGDTVLVTRTNQSGVRVSYDLELSKVLAGTNARSNIEIKPGDTIQVLPGQKVFVAGAVKKPGAFDVGRGQPLTVAKLMALSGGWKTASDPAKAVIVREGPNGQRQTVPVNLKKIMARKANDVTLEANDLLYVPGSAGKTVGLAVVKGVGGATMWSLGYLITGY